MVNDVKKESTIVTVECLRGHHTDVFCEHDLEHDDTRQLMKEQKCPQCGASAKSITDGEIWVGIAEPKTSAPHGGTETP